MAMVILSALVQRFSVSSMRDFFGIFWICLEEFGSGSGSGSGNEGFSEDENEGRNEPG